MSIPAVPSPSGALASAATPAAYLAAAHRLIVGAATSAPSVHNSQPWMFTSDEEGLDLFADESRRLPVLDPEGRLLHLSCGAALLHAQVAARAMGFLAEAVLLPTHEDPSHLARLQLSAGRPGSAADHALANAIPLRHTYRDAFSQRCVPRELIKDLQSAAEAQGTALVAVDGDDLIELEVLLAWADGLQEADPAYRAETAAAVHATPTSAGIPIAALAIDPQRGSSLRLRDFALVGPHAVADEPPSAERPDVVLIVSDDDSPLSWLRAGQSLGAVLLRAAEAGVVGQPLAQVTDFPAARVRLRQALGLVGSPQMALRLGFVSDDATPVGPDGATARRPVDDVLVLAPWGPPTA